MKAKIFKYENSYFAALQNADGSLKLDEIYYAVDYTDMGNFVLTFLPSRNDFPTEKIIPVKASSITFDSELKVHDGETIRNAVFRTYYPDRFLTERERLLGAFAYSIITKLQK